MSFLHREQRNHLRRTARQARIALTPSTRVEYSAKICAHIAGHRWWMDAGVVALYVPVGSEVDVWPLVACGLAAGRTMVVPRIVGDGQLTDRVMTFDRLTSALQTDLVRGPHDIPETISPGPVGPQEIDLVLVPAVAIDLDGNRLGGGAGYYDRWLAAARALSPVPRTLATVFDAQMVHPMSRIPTEPHDQPVDAVVTECNVMLFDTPTPDRH